MSSTSIPVIDVSPLAGDDAAARRAVAAEVGAACRDIGFFAITGHGVPAAVVDGTFAASADFFAQPMAAKQALAYASLSHNRGYVGTGVEALDEHRGADGAVA